jgi:hypothetical protein
MRREPDVRQEFVERAGTLMRDFAAMDEVQSFARVGATEASAWCTFRVHGSEMTVTRASGNAIPV